MVLIILQLAQYYLSYKQLYNENLLYFVAAIVEL